jgi:hypothetical protein
MKLYELRERFSQVLDSIYGVVKLTKAALARLDTEHVARPGTYEAAQAAAMLRDVQKGHRFRIKKNTRGLPKGYGVHDARRARLLMRSPKARERATDSQLQAAETFYDDLKECNRLRFHHLPRPSKFIRRTQTAWRKVSLKSLRATIQKKIALARKAGRVSFIKPLAF